MKKLSNEDAKFLGGIDPGKLKGPTYKHHIVLFIIIVFIAIAIFWAKFSIIDEIVRGAGKVIPSTQVQVVQNLEGGIVKKVLVSEGSVVKKNQALLIIDDTQFRAAYNDNKIKEQSLSIKLKRLTAEHQQKQFIIPQNIQAHEREIYQFELALFNAKQAELKELWTKYKLAEDELSLTKPLIAKGAASPVELLQLKRTVSDLKGSINKFNSDILDQLNKVKAELDSVREEVVVDKYRLERTVVKSPINGVVKQINVHTEGGVIKPGMDLMEIVPLDDTLLVEAKIKPKDIGFLKLNQSAKVNITAYDFAIHGSLTGKIEWISADSITDTTNKKSYYLIRVRTTKNYLGKGGNPLYIIPGMQAQVDIQTGKKSILSYLTSPITNTAYNALKER